MFGGLNIWLSMIKSNLGKNLLRFFVITLILVYGISVITEYNTLKPIVTDFSTKLVSGNLPMGVSNQASVPGTSQNIGEQITGSIIQYCKTNDNFVIPGSDFTISCTDVRAKGASALPEFITNTLMNDYYKNYDCSAVGCLMNIYFRRSPGDLMFIFSEKMNLFLKSLIPFLVLGVFLGVAIIAYRIREKFGISKEVGITLLGAAGIPFLIFLFILYKDQILVWTGILSGKEDFMRTTTTFFSGPIYSVVNLYAYLYGAVFIVGGVLAITGHYGLKKNPEAREKYEASTKPSYPNFPSSPMLGQMGQNNEMMKSIESSQKYIADLKSPQYWEKQLKQWLEEDYREMLVNLDGLPSDAKIPQVKERLLRKIEIKRTMMRETRQSLMPEAAEMFKVKLDAENKYLSILEKLANDIRMYEKEGKSGDEILENLRKTLLPEN